MNVAAPSAGAGRELTAIAAASVGGMSLSGGEGRIADITAGAILLEFITNGLLALKVSPYDQQVMQGAVLGVAILLGRARARYFGRSRGRHAGRLSRTGCTSRRRRSTGGRGVQVTGPGHPTTAARTHSTSGRCEANCRQLSPSSAEAYTSPLRLPK